MRDLYTIEHDNAEVQARWDELQRQYNEKHTGTTLEDMGTIITTEEPSAQTNIQQRPTQGNTALGGDIGDNGTDSKLDGCVYILGTWFIVAACVGSIWLASFLGSLAKELWYAYWGP